MKYIKKKRTQPSFSNEAKGVLKNQGEIIRYAHSILNNYAEQLSKIHCMESLHNDNNLFFMSSLQ